MFLTIFLRIYCRYSLLFICYLRLAIRLYDLWYVHIYIDSRYAIQRAVSLEFRANFDVSTKQKRIVAHTFSAFELNLQKSDNAVRNLNEQSLFRR